jgi:hypothetical protein
MKKISRARLSLHRETLRYLAGPELAAAEGGAIVVTSSACPVPVSGHYSCGGTCEYFQCRGTATSNAC